MQTINFTDVVEWLNNLKELYYLCKFVQTDPPNRENFDHAKTLETYLCSLEDIPLSEAMKSSQKKISLKYDKCGHQMVLSSDEPLGILFQEILDDFEERDEKFYCEAGFGKFWDEVPLPPFIEAIFEEVVRELQKEWPSLIGTESMAAKAGLREGLCAISYYDLSNILLVFQDEDFAQAFSASFPIEPSEFLNFYDGCWQCQ